MWRHLNLPPLTPVQRDICEWLQYGPKRSQTWAFRGAGKSYLTAGYALWLLYNNPEEVILVISASKDRADAFVQFTKRLIYEWPLLSHLKPNPLRGDRNSSVQYDVGACTPKQSPSVKAIGITGQMAGSRGSTIIMDDVEVPANSGTPQQREKLREAVKEVDAILLPASEATRVDPKVRVLGTPQSMETVYLQLEEAGYVPRVWPIKLPDTATLLGYRGALAPSLQKRLDDGEAPGEPSEPSRFNVVDVEERRISYGALGFALQFMLSTALADSEKYPLKLKDLIVGDFTIDKAREYYVHSNHPQFRLNDVDNVGITGDGFYQPADSVGEWTVFEETVLVVDPSGRGKDETAIAVGSRLAGNIFLHNIIGSLDGYGEDVLTMIALEAKRVKAHKIIVEANFGDGMFSNLLIPVLRKIYPCAVEEVKTSTVKERRMIDTLSPVMEAHRLIVHRNVIDRDKIPHTGDSDTRSRDRMLFYQMTHLTDERGCLAHDDRLDALALMVAHFAPSIALDAKEEARLRAELRMKDWEDSLFSNDAPEPSWLDTFRIPGASR